MVFNTIKKSFSLFFSVSFLTISLNSSKGVISNTGINSMRSNSLKYFVLSFTSSVISVSGSNISGCVAVTNMKYVLKHFEKTDINSLKSNQYSWGIDWTSSNMTIEFTILWYFRRARFLFEINVWKNCTNVVTIISEFHPSIKNMLSVVSNSLSLVSKKISARWWCFNKISVVGGSPLTFSNTSSKTSKFWSIILIKGSE